MARFRSGDAMTREERSPFASQALVSQLSMLRTRRWLCLRKTTAISPRSSREIHARNDCLPQAVVLFGTEVGSQEASP